MALKFRKILNTNVLNELQNFLYPKIYYKNYTTFARLKIQAILALFYRFSKDLEKGRCQLFKKAHIMFKIVFFEEYSQGGKY